MMKLNLVGAVDSDSPKCDTQQCIDRNLISDTPPIAVTTGCDENYAVALVVAVQSMLDTLAVNRRVDLYLLDGGLLPDSIERLKQSWDDPRLRVIVVPVDMDQLQGLPTQGHVTASSYLRLLIPQLLPSDVSKVVYIDSDMLVRRDLATLYDQDVADHSTLAVQDYAAPHIDADIALANQTPGLAPSGNPSTCVCPEIVARQPIVNYASLGIDPAGEYFNGGLLVINLDRWRNERLDRRMIDCLRDNLEHVLWWDQYALNAVLHDSWGRLDSRWNQGAHLFEYSEVAASPFGAEQYHQLASDPWVVHFCSPSKPWHRFCLHPYRAEYREVLSRTLWNDTPLVKPSRRFVKKWVSHQLAIRSNRQTRFDSLAQSASLAQAALLSQRASLNQSRAA